MKFDPQDHPRDPRGLYVEKGPPKMRRAVMPAGYENRDGRSLYFAYGSNLDIGQMKTRCPKAVPLWPLQLDNCELVFRGVADIIHRRRHVCLGGVWSITSECEKALDRYEGVRGDKGLYVKKYFDLIQRSGVARPVLYYQMRERLISPPSPGYLRVIENGYRDFGLDLAYLAAAVDRAEEAETERVARKMRGRRRGAWLDWSQPNYVGEDPDEEPAHPLTFPKH